MAGARGAGEHAGGKAGVGPRLREVERVRRVGGAAPGHRQAGGEDRCVALRRGRGRQRGKGGGGRVGGMVLAHVGGAQTREVCGIARQPGQRRRPAHSGDGHQAAGEIQGRGGLYLVKGGRRVWISSRSRRHRGRRLVDRAVAERGRGRNIPGEIAAFHLGGRPAAGGHGHLAERAGKHDVPPAQIHRAGEPGRQVVVDLYRAVGFDGGKSGNRGEPRQGRQGAEPPRGFRRAGPPCIIHAACHHCSIR